MVILMFSEGQGERRSRMAEESGGYMLWVGCHGIDDPNRAGLVFAAARGLGRNKDLMALSVSSKIALLADAVLLMKNTIAKNTLIAGPDRGSVADLMGQLPPGVEIWV